MLALTYSIRAENLRLTLKGMNRVALRENVLLAVYFGNVAILERPESDQTRFDRVCMNLGDILISNPYTGQYEEIPSCKLERRTATEDFTVWKDGIVPLVVTVYADNFSRLSEYFIKNKALFDVALCFAGLIEFQYSKNENEKNFQNIAEDAWIQLSAQKEITDDDFVCILLLLLKGWKYGESLFRWGLNKRFRGSVTTKEELISLLKLNQAVSGLRPGK